MNTIIEPLAPEAFLQRHTQRPAAPYLWAMLVLGAGLAFTLRGQADLVAFLLCRIAVAASLAITALATFRWGHQSGFAVLDKQGSLSVTNLLRNSVMTLVMFIGVGLLPVALITLVGVALR